MRNIELSCYIVEVVDDHGCSVVEDEADAPRVTDVGGENDEDDDDEGDEA